MSKMSNVCTICRAMNIVTDTECADCLADQVEALQKQLQNFDDVVRNMKLYQWNDRKIKSIQIELLKELYNLIEEK